MLNDDPDVVVAEPLILKCLNEWDTDEHECHHEEVGEGENEGVACDETTEIPGERGTILFP